MPSALPPRFGLQLWPQQTTWLEFRDSALAAEAAGWDSIWTWDHLLAIQGPWEQPIYEGWSLLTAVAAVTERVRIGLMVGANTFRNPGLTTKLAINLDHISNGRAVLGIGGAWFEREHEAFGIPFGSSVGERLDWLAEAVPLIRRLLDGEVVTHEGRFYRFKDALAVPRPIQERLPILIGGSGPKKTIPIVARYADGWNTSGTVEEVSASLDTLREQCEAVGRDSAGIELTVSFPTIIRDTVEAAEAARAAQLAHNGMQSLGGVATLTGSPDAIVETLRPYLELGFSTVIARMPAPFDRETIDRLPEVRALLR
ncbi:MAG TPA: TIGR03560 family F420-dependent LLM class oxidoreductase [Candidatus Binatia bacterium]|nr:TIGR03560 family F420-dependent LLM class oxidoreductase [Candidatus Binatia bacterium]